jgi:hypothetical protein
MFQSTGFGLMDVQVSIHEIVTHLFNFILTYIYLDMSISI